MIGYAMLGTNDQDRANAFYDAVFGAVGVGRLMTFPSGGIAWGVSWGVPMIAVGMPHDGAPASVGNGSMLAVTLDTRAKVDAMHAAAIAVLSPST